MENHHQNINIIYKKMPNKKIASNQLKDRGMFIFHVPITHCKAQQTKCLDCLNNKEINSNTAKYSQVDALATGK